MGTHRLYSCGHFVSRSTLIDIVPLREDRRGDLARFGSRDTSTEIKEKRNKEDRRQSGTLRSHRTPSWLSRSHTSQVKERK